MESSDKLGIMFIYLMKHCTLMMIEIEINRMKISNTGGTIDSKSIHIKELLIY